MINKAKRQEAKKLDIACDQLLNEMLTYGPDTPEFQECLEKLERVNKIRMAKSLLKNVDSNTLLIVLGNLLGIGIIVGYEQRHVVTSIATKFLLKP